MKLTGNLEELNAAIGLGFCEGVGAGTAAKLITKSGSAKGVFEMDKKTIHSIEGVSKKAHDFLSTGIDWRRVDKEVSYIHKHNINYVLITDPAYPKALKLIDQPPPIIFFTGEIELLNQRKCISIVGTRHATPYGMDMVKDFIRGLAPHNPCIISGLALGIDVAAHRASVEHGITTFGVVAHGLQTVYPSVHRKVAKEINKDGGGLITEFFSEELPNRENFPKRNRIIAGISSATIVVEAASKGGALITAFYANKYKRKVYAVPGRYSDTFSAGCNALIAKRSAISISSIDGLLIDLGFDSNSLEDRSQNAKIELSGNEKKIFEALHFQSKTDIDKISDLTNLNISECSHILLSMEMKGILRSLPGKIYELV